MEKSGSVVFFLGLSLGWSGMEELDSHIYNKVRREVVQGQTTESYFVEELRVEDDRQ
jgi:hypothetical protein